VTGLVAAGVCDDRAGHFVSATSEYAGNGRWRHAERVALERFLERYGVPGEEVVVVVSLAPCTHPESQSRLGGACALMLVESGIKHVHAGAIDLSTYRNTLRDYAALGLDLTFARDKQIRSICERLAGVFQTYGRRVNEDLPSIKREVPPP
jgi:pyrimidine deaminase RibD-like protein